MLTIKDVSPVPLPGQYWAWLNPLSLLRVEFAGDCPNFKLWQAGCEAEQDLCIVAPLNDNFRILRWIYPYSECSIARNLGIDEFKARTGDVFEVTHGMLAFAVVEYGGVNLYSDEKMPESSALIESVVQRGPGPPIGTPVKSRYERIIDEAKTNFSMVRSVGGVILRAKVKDPILLSHPNVGVEDRVHTNLNFIKER
jgi:hypothetical protein